MKILIVDDESFSSIALQYWLLKKGHFSIVINESREVINQITDKKPDLVILDVMMPYMSGFELIAKIRKEFKKSIHILVISGLDQPEVIETAFKIGADDYLTKPIKFRNLAHKLKIIESKAHSNLQLTKAG